jgi:radical SAM protein with 4Fe4S-binding SPASM domain
MQEEYSPFKAAHHIDRLEKLKKGELPGPVQMQIDLTNVCNHDCSYCTYRNPNKRSGTDFDEKNMISTDRIISLITEAKETGVKAILLLGGGEPLIHPGIEKIVKHIENLDLELALVSNGSLFNEEKVALFKNASWIRISVDAATDETYKLVQGTTHGIPKNKIRLIRKICKDTVLGVSFLTKPENFHEAYDAAVMAKELGANNIRFSIVQTMDGKDIMLPHYEKYFKLINKAKALEDKNFKIFGLTGRKIALENNKNYEKCLFQHFVAVVGANGNIYPCCWTKNLTPHILGSINEESFKDIWFGEKRKNYLKNQNLKDCPPCWFDKNNEFLNYLVKDKPRHVNFV